MGEGMAAGQGSTDLRLDPLAEIMALLHGPGAGPRWGWNGDAEKPTFTPSVLVRYNWSDGERVCHSFVTDGQIQFLGDCTHALAGQTVDIPAWEEE